MRPNNQLWSRIIKDQGGEVGRWDGKEWYPTFEMYESVSSRMNQYDEPRPSTWTDGGLIDSLFEEMVTCIDEFCGLDNTRLWATGRAG